MIGEQAANRLLERIEAKERLPGKHIMLDTLLIQRRSCGCNGC
jgi:DNA-binding LacI/PurR family transcriptional regulator